MEVFNLLHNPYKGPLKDGQKYEISRNEETGEVILTIKNCSMKDAGEVEARIDEESTKSKFDVTQGPAKFICSKIQRMETQCGQSVDISVKGLLLAMFIFESCRISVVFEILKISLMLFFFEIFGNFRIFEIFQIREISKILEIL